MSKTNKFKINEIFYSLQGEGFFAGTPAVFIRFSGCNLTCPFCDTNHSEGLMMDIGEILSEVEKYPATHIVLTGGEPSLFISQQLVDALKAKGKRRIAIETNGTHPLPDNIDWITLSPKFDILGKQALPAINRCDELKVVYNGQSLAAYESINATHRFLQPCDCGDDEKNTEIRLATIDACLTHPQWRLSLQTHKILSIR